MAAVHKRRRAGGLSLFSHEREGSGSLISLVYKVTGRQCKRSHWLVCLSMGHFSLMIQWIAAATDPTD